MCIKKVVQHVRNTYKEYAFTAVGRNQTIGNNIAIHIIFHLILQKKKRKEKSDKQKKVCMCVCVCERENDIKGSSKQL